MGTGAKVLIVLGIVAGLGLVVCCGGAGFMAYKAAPRVTNNPAEVATKTQDIIEMDISEDQWEPVFHMEMSIPLLMDMSMANWKSKTAPETSAKTSCWTRKG